MDVTLDGRAAAFPYLAVMAKDKTMEFAFHLKGVAPNQSFFIVPDDQVLSIAVNGVEESLSGVDPKQLSDVEHGFRFPLAQHCKAGDNRVVIRVQNHGGPGGLDVRPDPSDWRNRLEIAAGAVACLVLLGAGLSKARCDRLTIGFAVAGLALRFGYLSVTPYAQRAHDYLGHIEYVEYLLSHHAVPRAGDGYSFYHPPLYYLLAALLWGALQAIGAARDEILVALQLQSMLYELGFVAFGVATMRLWLERVPVSALGPGPWSRAGLAALCSALLLVWPSSVMHSVRVGNDDLAYLFIGAGLYYASRWWIRGVRRDANLAALAGALGMVTKTNSLLVFIVLALLLAARLVTRWREGKPVPPRRVFERTWIAASLFVASTGVALGRAFSDTLAGRQDNLIVGNASWNPSNTQVGRHAENFLWLDLSTFVNQAFTSPWEDAKGRQQFWHFLLKTSLFGEWEFKSTWVWNLAVVLSVLLLCLLVCTLVGTLLREPSEWLEELPLFLLTGGLVAGSLALRMRLPGVSSGDFRYILPVLVPLTWWFARGTALYWQRRWWKAAVAGVTIGWLFAATSVAVLVAIVLSGE
jgi:hypothetical protein